MRVGTCVCVERRTPIGQIQLVSVVLYNFCDLHIPLSSGLAAMHFVDHMLDKAG